MRVSVIIAAHNAEMYLAATLESVLAQTHRPLEIILVDDGSTDGTLSIAEAYKDAHPDFLQVIHQENMGACAARNRGMHEATGSYIQFLDSDDVLHPEKLERQMRRLASEPEDTLATGPWVRFQGAVATADHSWSAPDFRDFSRASDWLIQSWSGKGTIPTHSWLIPVDLVRKAGPWNEALLRNQDGEFFARVVVNARKIAFVEGAWAYYRSGHSNTVSGRTSDEVLRSLFESCALCEQTLLSHRNTPEARSACAGVWQKFAFSAYPRLPDLVHRAERRAEELGGYAGRPSVIRPLRPVRDILGWKMALRLQRFYLRLRPFFVKMQLLPRSRTTPAIADNP